MLLGIHPDLPQRDAPTAQGVSSEVLNGEMAGVYVEMAGELAALRSERERDKARIRELESRLQAEVNYNAVQEAERARVASEEAERVRVAAAAAAAAASEARDVQHSVMGVLEISTARLPG